VGKDSVAAWREDIFSLPPFCWIRTLWGTPLLVNLAVKRMPPQLRAWMDVHYTLGRGASTRADLLGISRNRYWAEVKNCRRFIEGYLAARQDRAA